MFSMGMFFVLNHYSDDRFPDSSTAWMHTRNLDFFVISHYRKVSGENSHSFWSKPCKHAQKKPMHPS